MTQGPRTHRPTAAIGSAMKYDSTMPVYEFQCRACAHQYEDLVPFADPMAGQSCPGCTSVDVEQRMSTFRARRSGGGTTISVDGTACLPGPAGAAATGGRRAGCCGGGCGGC